MENSRVREVEKDGHQGGQESPHEQTLQRDEGLAMQISGSFQAEDPVWQGQEAVRGPGLEQVRWENWGTEWHRSHRRKLTGMPLAAVLSVDCQGQGQEQRPARGPFSKSGKI